LGKQIYFLSFIIIALVFVGFVSSQTVDYNACITLGNSSQDCSNYITFSNQAANEINHISNDQLNILGYIDCVNSEKQKANFNYANIRDICYTSQIKTTPVSFRSNCFYDYNYPEMTVSCKGLFPTKDYNWDVSINTDTNKNIFLVPKLKLKKDFTLGHLNFSLFVKKFDMPSLNLNVSDNIIIKSLSLESEDSNSSNGLLFPNKQTTSNIDLLMQSYLDCITINILMAKQKGSEYIAKKSGYEFSYDVNNLETRCQDNVSYAFGVNLQQYVSKKSSFVDLINILTKNYLDDWNFSANKLNKDLNDILNESDKYEKFEKDHKKIHNNSVKLGLDADYLLSNLEAATKDLKPDEKEAILQSAGPTLLKSKEDLLSLRRKTKLFSIIDFFDSDKNNITEPSLKELYSDIEYNLIKQRFNDLNKVDVTNVNAVISQKSINLSDFSFDFSKPLVLDYNSDKNNSILFKSDANNLIISLKDYNIITPLSLNVKNNLIYFGNKAIKLLDLNSLENIFRGKAKIDSVELITQDSYPIYVVRKEISGRLLGIIQIKEIIINKYYANTGILLDTSKPWWDFLVVYNF